MPAQSASNLFQHSVAGFIARVEAEASDQDGLTWAELGDTFTSLFQLAVRLASDLGNSGADKKQLVMAAVTELVDKVLGYVPLGWFDILRPFVLPTVRHFILQWADGAVESVYRNLSKGPAEL